MGKGYEPIFEKEMGKGNEQEHKTCKTIKLTKRCPISLAIIELQVGTG